MVTEIKGETILRHHTECNSSDRHGIENVTLEGELFCPGCKQWTAANKWLAVDVPCDFIACVEHQVLACPTKGYDCSHDPWHNRGLSFEHRIPNEKNTMTTKAEQLVTKEEISKLMLEHGFTIKEGQTDLKPYVYDAAYAIVQHVMSRYLPVGNVQMTQDKNVAGGVLTTSSAQVVHDQMLYALAMEAVPPQEPTAEEIDNCMRLFNTSPVGLPSLLRAYRNFCTAYDTVRILSSALNKAR